MRKWFHITFSTYGTWLPGDPRGFRTYKHKRHSSGDYRHRPPEGEHSGLRKLAQTRMRTNPITLTLKQRKICGLAIVKKLTRKECKIIAIGVGAQHVHIQLRMEDRNVKRVIGAAKQYASHRLRNELPGTIWATYCQTEPVRSKEHQRRLFHYIRHHRKEGAFVWTYQDKENSKKNES